MNERARGTGHRAAGRAALAHACRISFCVLLLAFARPLPAVAQPAPRPEPGSEPGPEPEPGSEPEPEPGPEPEPEPEPEPGPEPGSEPANPSSGEVIVVTGDAPFTPEVPTYRANTRISRDEIDLRLPRSAPDALRYEPGVFVQQTAHSQGSAFIRGLTGQQTLLLFDGIRLNNGTYRQGPNQYFFTLDAQSIESIQVLRGGASTRYGSDALGGVILAKPIEPGFRPSYETTFFTYQPHLIAKGATADSEVGGRTQLALTVGDSIAFFGGAGGRRVGLLESGGVVESPADGQPPLVPRFEDDGRTQLGTGFNEMTADGRLHLRVGARNTVKLAAYVYRQFDAPRTDQCPAAYAPYDECLNYDEQFRTLVYGVWESRPRLGPMDDLRATLSWQRQHERRTLRRPSSEVENIGRDTVDTFGVTVAAETRPVQANRCLELRGRYGADTYHDLVDSAAWIEFTDIDLTQERSRGQYLDGSTFTYGGVFAEGIASWRKRLHLRAGGRMSWVRADAPADPDSGSRPIDRTWWPLVGNAGVEYRLRPQLRLLANVDRSFRAPNLDDMTSRQQTGPGFQFENPDLEPEKATTVEVGARVVGRVLADLWVFQSFLDDAVIKSPREAADCPPDTQGCESSWSRFQLVNARDGSVVRGIEASLYAHLLRPLTARVTAAWTWGEGPNVGDPPSTPDPANPFPERVPLSRIPPLNGTVELLWRCPCGFTASTGARWAARQERLALADISDERIPAGGTPGFAVFDLRFSYRLNSRLLASLALENLFDAAYRYHGSSVNGPGRGLVVLLDAGPLWRH